MKLNVDRITDAGMATFADVGFSGLSMRQVADRLGVHAGSLYYHVSSKTALLALMADRVAQEAYDACTAALAALPGDADWVEQITAQALAVRSSIGGRPGGAALFASSPRALSSGALSLMERLLHTLREAGVPEAHGIVAADTLLSHLTGFVLQEQSKSLHTTTTAATHAALAERFPLTLAGAASYEEDELFTRSVTLICAATTIVSADKTPRN